MDRSAVRRIVEANLARLMGELGVRHWTVDVDYDFRGHDDGTPGRTVGRCVNLLDYDRATIHLDPDGLDDEAEVLDVLRHELFHVVLAPYDLFGNVVEELTKGNPKLDKAAARVWRHAQERAVAALERMYENLKGGTTMGRQKPAKSETKAPTAQPRPKAGPKPAPKGTKGKGK